MKNSPISPLLSGKFDFFNSLPDQRRIAGNYEKTGLVRTGEYSDKTIQGAMATRQSKQSQTISALRIANLLSCKSVTQTSCDNKLSFSTFLSRPGIFRCNSRMLSGISAMKLKKKKKSYWHIITSTLTYVISWFLLFFVECQEKLTQIHQQILSDVLTDII